MLGRAVLVCGVLAPAAAAAQALPDPRPPADCSLLGDAERQPSTLRHLHWSIKTGSSERARRIVAPSVGWSVLGRERLCRRQVGLEHILEYRRAVLALRVDFEYELDDDRPAVRAVADYSIGANPFGWFAAGASAGPEIDGRGLALTAGIAATAVGVELEVRWAAGIDWRGHDVTVLLGVSNLHLMLAGVLSPD